MHTERVAELRRKHLEWLSTADPSRLVFIDESGCNLAMARHHARAPRGQRALDRVPRKRGGPITIIGALTLDGLDAVMTVDGGTDRLVFQTYVDEVLVPTLHAGDIVVLDQLGAHKPDRIRRSIEAAGCTLVFQSPYSPDFNPIEHAWSKLKAFLRGARARSRDALDTAIAMGMDTITPDDAHGWFQHCQVPVHRT